MLSNFNTYKKLLFIVSYVLCNVFGATHTVTAQQRTPTPPPIIPHPGLKGSIAFNLLTDNPNSGGTILYLLTMKANGSKLVENEKTFQIGPRYTFFSDQAWTSDGYLYYVSWGKNANEDLVIRKDNGTLVSESSLGIPDREFFRRAALQKLKTQLYWSDEKRVYSAPAIGLALTKATIVLDDDKSSRYTQLSISPDGKKLVVVAESTDYAAPARKVQLLLIESGQQKILFESAKTSWTNSILDNFPKPAWSPSGKELAFADADGIHIIDVGSGKDQVLTGCGAFEEGKLNNNNPTWSPDERYIAFTAVYHCDVGAAKQFPAIFVMQADGKNVSLLVNWYSYLPSWSPK